MQKIQPCLWFNGNALEAMNFYVSVFKNAKAGKVSRYEADTPHGKKGDVLAVTFEIENLEIIGINAGPEFPFSEAVSLSIDCKDQAEVDYYWEKLLADGGKPSQCGWLKDKFGFSWQVVPRRLVELQNDPDTAKVARVMQAMMKMVKLDVAQLEAAAAAK